MVGSGVGAPGQVDTTPSLGGAARGRRGLALGGGRTLRRNTYQVGRGGVTHMGSHVSPPRRFWATGVTAAAVRRFHQQLTKPPKRCLLDWLKGQPVEEAGVHLSAVKHLLNLHCPYTGYLLSYLQDSPGMLFSYVFFSVLGHLKLSPQLLQVCGLPAFMVILLFFDDFSSHMYLFHSPLCVLRTLSLSHIKFLGERPHRCGLCVYSHVFF